MKYSDIDLIIEKYWDGTSSLEDEMMIKDYFREGNISEEHHYMTPLFDYYNQASQMSSLDHTSTAKVITLNKTKKANWLIPVLSIAATLTLFLSVYLFQFKETTPQNGGLYVVETPEEALEITKDALAFLSIKMEKGSATVNETVKKIDVPSLRD